jgi:hypothetical protein
MSSARSTIEYSNSFAVKNSGENGQILCPCMKCCNGFWLGTEEVHEQLVWSGFLSGYTSWVFHGECLGDAEPTFQPSTSPETHSEETDDRYQLLVDVLGCMIASAWIQIQSHCQM